MTFPLGQSVSTANVASPDSDPSLAREDFLNLITLVNQLIASANIAQGVLVLDSGGRINSARLPGTYITTGGMTLSPSTGVVTLQKVLRLAQIYAEDLGAALGTSSPSAGDLCYLVNGDAGRPCIGVYDGTSWRVVRLSTTVGTVGAALVAVSQLACDGDIV